MNYEQDDVLYNFAGDPLDEAFGCGGSPGPMGSGLGEGSLTDSYRPFGDPHSPAFTEMSGMQYHDNSLTVPMDDYQHDGSRLGSSNDFETLQPPLQVPTTSYQEMAPASYSNGDIGGYEGMSNGRSMGSDPFLVETKTTPAFYPKDELGGSPMMGLSPGSRQQSRPSSRNTFSSMKHTSNPTGALQQLLSTPSTYTKTSVPISMKTTTAPSQSKSHRSSRQQNGRKKQNPNTVGAVLAKANKLASTPSAASGVVRLSKENTELISQITKEIEMLQADKSGRDHNPRLNELRNKQAAIFFEALATQPETAGEVATAAVNATRSQPAPSNRRSQPSQRTYASQSSPVYTPQCGTSYSHDMAPSYSTPPSTSHYQPRQPQQLYKVGTAPVSNVYLQQGSAPMHSRQRVAMVKLQPPVLSSPSPSSSTTPTTTVRAALKQGYVQQHHAQQPMPPMGSSPVPPMQMVPGPVHPKFTPAQSAKRVEEKRMSRLSRLREFMSHMASDASNPRTEDPFEDENDILRRLMPYHFFYEPELSPAVYEEFDTQYLRSMVDIGERTRKVAERMRRSAMKEAMDPNEEERNLLLYLDMDYEKRKLEEERKIFAEDPDVLRPLFLSTRDALSVHPHLPPPSDRLSSLPPPPPRITFSYEDHPFIARHHPPSLPPSPSTPPPQSPPSPHIDTPPSSHSFTSNPPFDRRRDEPMEMPTATAIGGLEEEAESESSLSPEMGISPESPIRPPIPTLRVVPPIKRKTSPVWREEPPMKRMEQEREMERIRLKKMEEEKREREEKERREREDKEKRDREEKERIQRDRIYKERILREEKERREAEEREKERRRREEEVVRERPPMVMPLKIKLKMAARIEDKKEEEERERERLREMKKVNGHSEKKEKEKDREKEKKHKKKKKKKKREEETEEEREKRRREKKARKEEEKRRKKGTEGDIPSIPRIKIKLGGTPSQPPVVTTSSLPSTTHQSLPSTSSSSTTTTNPSPIKIPKLKIKLGGGNGTLPVPAPPSVSLPTLSVPPPPLIPSLISSTTGPSPLSALTKPLSLAPSTPSPRPLIVPSIPSKPPPPSTLPQLMSLSSSTLVSSISKLPLLEKPPSPASKVVFTDSEGSDDDGEALRQSAEKALNRCAVSARPSIASGDYPWNDCP